MESVPKAVEMARGMDSELFTELYGIEEI